MSVRSEEGAMHILKYKNCRVCVTPLVAMVEMIAIFYAVHAFAAVEGLAFSVVDCLIISALIFIGSLGSLFMHEYAHMLAAQRMGLPVQGIIISLSEPTRRLARRCRHLEGHL